MTIEIKVPDLPESVADATIATWHKKPGDLVARDEVLVDIETDKVVLEVPAPEAGVLGDILQSEGATVLSRQLIAMLKPAPVAGEATSEKPVEAVADDAADGLSPSVRRMVAEHDIDVAKLTGTGKGGRVTKEDVEAFIKNLGKAPVAAPTAAAPVAAAPVAPLAGRTEKRVPMTRLRKRIAERLLEAKNTTAMLTTFNEINMAPIMKLRKQYGEIFEKKHGIKLGFMSFYVKAVVESLKRYPEVNAALDGDDIVYHNYFDVSIAVSTPRGLVTPVLRDCDNMSLADIEKAIKDLAGKGRDGKLTVDELTGGNFTITNGGVFGSLMSTPIINPPQSAILGMHKIQDRPMAVDGKVEILPMMYLALSYDHRIIDGRESVGFLVSIKELLEDPTRLLLDV
ncbi:MULTISPECIES: 2-oxoglutarate dehydrogenase complex dihydrolipoyllysine-residue succinyltransferase [Aeromonas]|jgi:2-oxoglutarate dehydrogenase E2 component (dihydrolipoamide succinyltransferase)|uniref:Dihydrolipoyllysine-residue succinyltransferase component of 2-oxoglutarate dehydrogenase complex n=2 Tax=Aeromonas TaxID=642 RepID=A0A443W290_AERCA|nr:MULTISPECIES: 2-oxoglutarate dehydrogenase complex dihydrolipoyllysine-residue succinyltransferase [Aeromonas]AUU20786.1 dihydrolipoyllysine-residue succinyltransferase [Aeromonas caviae]AUV12370.1 dihydrolipoyllysine-residue succinyltransferase [Aeromonas sp. ASNIH3]AUY11640.1 dihydrolipoyllysine-residue succinyltransferase [Aeromonas sp. ASNIH2]AUZ81397.1 dihydrolipoyllysine-residue succinyltransferase [Aeromonas sp. ASNIH1]AXB07062.1 2-oxoglutarate dehydrogenase complex dihydrolipoyllysi